MRDHLPKGWFEVSSSVTQKNRGRCNWIGAANASRLDVYFEAIKLAPLVNRNGYDSPR